MYYITWGFSGGSVVKNLLANVEDVGLILGSGRYPGGGNGNPIQYSHLENPKDRGAWQATVNGVVESDTTEHLTHTLLPKRSHQTLLATT